MMVIDTGTSDLSHSEEKKIHGQNSICRGTSILQKSPIRESYFTAQRLDAFPSVLEGQF